MNRLCAALLSVALGAGSCAVALPTQAEALESSIAASAIAAQFSTEAAPAGKQTLCPALNAGV